MGVRYFKCLSSHGTFVLPERVTIGDFPVLDPFEDEEIWKRVLFVSLRKYLIGIRNGGSWGDTRVKIKWNAQLV